MRLKLSDIRLDGGTQPRAFINPETVDDYSDMMMAGTKFPALIVFYDGESYWLADGFHRHKASFAAGIDEIECDIRQGTREDAQWFSFGANQTHGLRRSNEDKQRAIKAALTHPGSKGLSDTQIANHLGVAVSTVGDWRRKLGPTIGNLESKRIGADGRAYNVTNIGKRPAAEPAATPEVPTPRPAPQPISAPVRAVEQQNTTPVEAAAVAEEEPAIEVEALDAFLRALAMIEALPVAPNVLADFVETQPNSKRIYEQMEIANEYIRQTISAFGRADSAA